MGDSLNVGIVGAGVISAQYLETIGRLPELNLAGIADIDRERAEAVGRQHGAPGMSVEELLGHEGVDAVINLTVPGAHAEVSLAAVEAGKGVFVEKPLAATFEDGMRMVQAAEQCGAVLGSAPDTVLGTGVQTARDAIDSGRIGVPTSATVTMIRPGHESWHPNPDFYYQPGGGPLFDMGPYYLTSLVTLLGPVATVIGAANALRTERVIGSGPRAGEAIPVSTPSHVTGALVHKSGVVSTVVMSFDGVSTRAAHIEVQGTEGTVEAPDPNRFDGTVRLSSRTDEWEELPVTAGYQQAARGYGVADMLWTGGFSGDPQAGRAQGALGLHVLEIMEGILTAAEQQTAVRLSTRAERPASVPLDER